MKCSSEVRPFVRAHATTCAKNSFATSASSNRSRFLVNVVASHNRLFRESYSPEAPEEALTTTNFAPPVDIYEKRAQHYSEA